MLLASFDLFLFVIQLSHFGAETHARLVQHVDELLRRALLRAAMLHRMSRALGDMYIRLPAPTETPISPGGISPSVVAASTASDEGIKTKTLDRRAHHEMQRRVGGGYGAPRAGLECSAHS